MAVALRITATLSPGEQATYSMQLVGSIAEVVMLAVGLLPIAKWQCAPPPFARRSMVTPAPTAVDCTLVPVTVITWVVPSAPKVVSCPLSSRNSLLILVPSKVIGKVFLISKVPLDLERVFFGQVYMRQIFCLHDSLFLMQFLCQTTF